MSCEPENESGPENESELIAPTPLPTKMPESVVDPVPPFPTPRVPVRKLVPILVVATMEPLALVERSLLVRLEMAKDEEVALVRVVDPLKVLIPEKVLLFASKLVERKLVAEVVENARPKDEK